MATVPAIRTEGLTKHYGEVVALDHLDLTVQPGEIFGFLGPNGAGKSTTIKLLLGLLRPTGGQAWLAGIPVSDVERAHRSVGYVPGDVVTVAAADGCGDPRAARKPLRRCRRRVSRRARSSGSTSTRADASGRTPRATGRRSSLVAAFMTRPDILLLDEPTVGLDPLMEAQFQALAGRPSGRGQTVFLSSHLLDEVEDVCHRVGDPACRRPRRGGDAGRASAPHHDDRRGGPRWSGAVVRRPARCRLRRADRGRGPRDRCRPTRGGADPAERRAGSPGCTPRTHARADLPHLLRDQCVAAAKRWQRPTASQATQDRARANSHDQGLRTAVTHRWHPPAPGPADHALPASTSQGAHGAQ